MEISADDSLVSRRSKRSTAGNRMEAALAELGIEDLTKEVEDDKDFFVERDEEDIFGSDFESTDEETNQVDELAGDKVVDDEEKRARKAKRTQLERVTAAAHARNKVTFNPQAESSTKTKLASKSKGTVGRRVSFADGAKRVNVDDNDENLSGKGKGKRQSRRSHTVLNTSATVSRMKTAEERRASVPKKTPIIQKSYGQSELISRALDTEEGNIIEHRDYLKMEEEKRKRARVIRAHVEGPLVRWVSRAENVKVTVAQPVQAPIVEQMRLGPPPTQGQGYYGYAGSGSGPQGYYSYPHVTNSSHYPTQASTSTSQPPPQPHPQLQTSYYYSPAPTPALPPVTRIEKFAKNYVVYEISQAVPAQKPQWHETMGAVFGTHVKWEDMRVFVGRGRPLSRPKQTCPLTGLPARYLDPRTNVPYANIRAYQILTRILKHEYIWSEQLGSYVAKEGERKAMGLQGKARKGKEREVGGKGKRRTRDEDAMDTS